MKVRAMTGIGVADCAGMWRGRFKECEASAAGRHRSEGVIPGTSNATTFLIDRGFCLWLSSMLQLRSKRADLDFEPRLGR